MANWQRSRVGCYWYWGAYAICTARIGKTAGYYLYKDRRLIGDRYATWEAATTAALRDQVLGTVRTAVPVQEARS